MLCCDLCCVVLDGIGPRDFIFLFSRLVGASRIVTVEYSWIEIRFKGLSFLYSELGKLSRCWVLSRWLGFSRRVLCFGVRKGIFMGPNCVYCNASVVRFYLFSFLKFWKFFVRGCIHICGLPVLKDFSFLVRSCN